jgi:aspartate carbamoyltransferase catalytic subunit
MHIVSTRGLAQKDIEAILKDAAEFEKGGDHTNVLKDKIMAALFFEPSTRTRFSFESAMNRLGGKILGFESPDCTSTKKGETLADTIKIISGYTDVIVMRHSAEGASKLASEVSPVPIINAGDGSHDHPTQTLIDLYTIKKKFGKLEGLKVGICGDLRYGRTGRPLAIALSHYGADVYFISPPQLSMDKGTVKFLKSKDVKVTESLKIEEVIKELDVLYITRIQRERFATEEDYLKFKGVYVINKELMEKASPDMIVMHPLPRINEISYEVDDDPRAKYFEQAKNGVPVRMAVLKKALTE